jgi:hypothetical protein
MGIADLEATITRLEQAAEDARAATREANEAQQALRRAERDARDTITAIRAEVVKTIDERMGELVATELDRYRKQLHRAAHDGYANVRDQFDRMVNICQYGNEQGRGRNIFDEMRDRALEIQAAAGRPGDPMPDPTLPSLPPTRRKHR